MSWALTTSSARCAVKVRSSTNVNIERPGIFCVISFVGPAKARTMPIKLQGSPCGRGGGNKFGKLGGNLVKLHISLLIGPDLLQEHYHVFMKPDFTEEVSNQPGMGVVKSQRIIKRTEEVIFLSLVVDRKQGIVKFAHGPPQRLGEATTFESIVGFAPFWGDCCPTAGTKPKG